MKPIQCPVCAQFAGERPITRFTIEQISHIAPGIWVSGRSSQHTGTGPERYRAALQDWVDQCQLIGSSIVQRSM